MKYLATYTSPLGAITLASDEERLIGCWFDGQKHDRAALLGEETCERATPVLDAAKAWLDVYFSGKDPGASPPLRFTGTSFQRLVCELMSAIPYGRVATYGALAVAVASRMRRDRTSARAVGGAVGRNPLSLFVPCHRVVGADGRLTGYAGGLERKVCLLELEGVPLTEKGVVAPEARLSLFREFSDASSNDI